MPRDYPEYEDESPEETYRDPLKPFLIALVVLLLLFAAIIVLLYMRLQTANSRAETLSQELTAVQDALDDLRAQRGRRDADAHADRAPNFGQQKQIFYQRRHIGSLFRIMRRIFRALFLSSRLRSAAFVKPGG